MSIGNLLINPSVARFKVAKAYFQATVESFFSELRNNMKAWSDDFNLHVDKESELLSCEILCYLQRIGSLSLREEMSFVRYRNQMVL